MQRNSFDRAGFGGGRFWRRLCAKSVLDRRGNVAVVFALSMPMVVGGVAFGVETGYWYYQQLRLQQAADVAAQAGAIEQRVGKSHDIVVASATAAAEQNGFTPGSITVNTPPTSGPNMNSNSVEVLLSRNEQRFFSQLFSTDPVVSNARAVSTYTNAANACVLALDPIADGAAHFSGNSTTTLSGCSVMANSLASDAVYLQGSTVVTTTCVETAGGLNSNGGLTMTGCSAPMTSLPPVADPLKNLAEPLNSGNCKNGNGNTLQPGRYCNGLNLNGNVQLRPGTYIIDAGTLKINANANISGDGVTIYLVDNATLDFNGNANINLTAPTSGTYAGILFFGARENSMAVNKINGTATSSMTGTFYFPTQEVDYQGNFAGANGCTHIIADLVQWTGNATVGVDCTAYGMADIPVAKAVRLVE
jgi:Flp pilus assembly protein TadG